MKSSLPRVVSWAAASLIIGGAAVAAAPPAGKESPKEVPSAPLRSASAVLDDYALALGGPKAWTRRKSVHVRRSIEAPGMQIRGTEERWATSAGKGLTVTTIEGMGRFRQGSNGKIRWSEDPINGLRVLKGAEDEEARIEAIWSSELMLKKLYKEVRSVPPPVPVPPGGNYECVELVPRLAPRSVACFDAKTHLRAVQTGRHASPQGEVPYTTKFRDYREVGGIKLPYTEEMTAGPMTLHAKVIDVAFDIAIDPKMFERPKKQ